MSRMSPFPRLALDTRLFTRGNALLCCLLAGAAALSGCASQSSGGGVLDKALEAVGLSKPAPPELSADNIKLPTQPKKVTLRLHAAETLNTDANGKALSVVARVYKLRSATTFLQAPYDAFKDASSERQAFGNDIIESREVVLTPGKKYEVIETLPSETAQIAIVALFRTPDPQRWKFVFDAKDAVKTGVTLGLHACAMSVAGGEPLGASLEVRRLAGMHCPES